MNLINIEQQEDGRVTLAFTRDEFHLLRNALDIAIDFLDAQADKQEMLIDQLEGATEDEVREALEEQGLEESLEELKAALRIEKKLRPKVNALASALEDIVSEHDLARHL